MSTSVKAVTALIAGIAAVVGAVIGIQAYLDARYLKKADVREVALYWTAVVNYFQLAMPLIDQERDWTSAYNSELQSGLPFSLPAEDHLKSLKNDILVSRANLSTAFDRLTEQARRLELPVPGKPQFTVLCPVVLTTGELSVGESNVGCRPVVMKKH